VSYCGKEYEAKDFCERIHLRGAESLATYITDFYQSQPCLTVHAYGKGKAYYQAFRGKEDFVQDVIDELLEQLEITKHIQDAPKGVSAQKRSDGDHEYLFIENYSEAPVESIALNGAYRDMVCGGTVDSVSLDPFSIRILKKIRGN
jgi:beta-galactosidase